MSGMKSATYLPDREYFYIFQAVFQKLGWRTYFIIFITDRYLLPATCDMRRPTDAIFCEP